MVRQFITFSPERRPNLPAPSAGKELKVRKMYKSSSKNLRPELKPNREQKADEMHASPAIAKPNVAFWPLSSVV
jgi:hypothetical protein